MCCVVTVRSVAGARPADGSGMRETASECDACDEKTLSILRVVRQANETLEPAEGRNHPSSVEPHEGANGQVEKGQIDGNLKVIDWGFQ